MSVRPPLASAAFDLLCNEYVDYLMRNHDDSRGGKEALFAKLEAGGYDIGRRLAEKLTWDKPRMAADLDVFKWLCRKFWVEVFRKPADRLQTNNKGVYLLIDLAFRWTQYMSPPLPTTSEESRPDLLKYLIFPCGLIRGALTAFGLDCAVHVDIANLPRVEFEVRLKEA